MIEDKSDKETLASASRLLDQLDHRGLDPFPDPLRDNPGIEGILYRGPTLDAKDIIRGYLGALWGDNLLRVPQIEVMGRAGILILIMGILVQLANPISDHAANLLRQKP